MKPYHQFSIDLKEILLRSELPGISAQLKMAPETRRKELAHYPSQTPRLSAVLMCFFEKNNEPHFIMIKRASDESVHSGQIAFPGGKYEDTDSSLIYTAIRESQEEIGLIPSTVEVIGQLSDLYIPPSNFMVTPFIGFLKQKPEFIINEEVDKVLIFSLSELLNPLIRTEQEIQHRKVLFKVPCFKLGGETVWGATAMMLAEFIELLKTNQKT
jgi:8-oxo-dGTP pyrophosphatase MutT (NUDIX family)